MHNKVACGHRSIICSVLAFPAASRHAYTLACKRILSSHLYGGNSIALSPCSGVVKDHEVYVPGSADNLGSTDCRTFFSRPYFVDDTVYDDDSDSPESDMSQYEGNPVSVVPEADRKHRLVAYIVNQTTASDAMANVMVYTNSSALPLLLPMKTKWTKGSSWHNKICCSLPIGQGVSMES